MFFFQGCSCSWRADCTVLQLWMQKNQMHLIALDQMVNSVVSSDDSAVFKRFVSTAPILNWVIIMSPFNMVNKYTCVQQSELSTLTSLLKWRGVNVKICCRISTTELEFFLCRRYEHVARILSLHCRVKLSKEHVWAILLSRWEKSSSQIRDTHSSVRPHLADTILIFLNR